MNNIYFITILFIGLSIGGFFLFWYIVALCLGYNGFSDINTAFRICMMVHGFLIINSYLKDLKKLF
jgi:hypothetical protein